MMNAIDTLKLLLKSRQMLQARRMAQKNRLLIFFTIFVALFFIAMKLLSLFKFHEFFWDEAVYIGIGKFMFSFGTVGLWEVIRPPVLPLILGLFWRIGLDITLWSEIVIILFSSGLLWMTYLVGTAIMPKRYAAIAPVLLSFTPIFFQYSSRVMTGIPSAFFAMFAIYLVIERKSLFLAGLFSALAFLTRFPQGIIIVSLGTVVCYYGILRGFSSRKLSLALTRFSSGALSLITPYIIFNLFIYKDEVVNPVHAAFRPFLLSFVHQGNIFEAVQGGFYNMIFYGIEIFRENYLFLFSVIGILYSLWYLIRNIRFSDRGGRRLSGWISLPHISLLLPLLLYLAYFTLIVNKQTRFTLAFLPIVAIYAACGIMVFMKSLSGTGRHGISKYLFITFFIAVIVLSAMPIISSDYRIFYYLPEERPDYADTLCYDTIAYLKEPILISDPVCIAYLDKLMIPYYQDNVAGIKVYENNWLDAGSLVYHDGVYPCLDGDIACREVNEHFFDRLMDENMLLESQSHYGVDYYFFETGHE